MKTITIRCSLCKTSFEKSTSEYTACLRRGYTNFYCSKQCSYKSEKCKKQTSGIKLIEFHSEEYFKCPKMCLNCKELLPYEKRHNKFCSIKCSSLFSHNQNGNRKWDDARREKVSNWMKIHGYRHPSLKITKQCPYCECSFQVHLSKKEVRKCCSKTCSLKWMKDTGYLKGKCGGYRQKGGRGKQGWYKGYYCNSSWELAWIIYNLDHSIPFIRNTKPFDYTFNGKSFKYYPDFFIPQENKYVEIKGYKSPQSDQKLSQFPHLITVLYRNDMAPYISYVQSKYGKDFIKLYDNISDTSSNQ